MKYFGLLFFSFLLFSIAPVKAQQNHFIYIQTENKQPFYIKIDKKIISSSVSGYLIIPKLTDGEYNFTVGFPKNEWDDQNFICKVDKKDAGYLLKNFGEKGWGLFNLQTLDVNMAVNKPETKTPGANDKSDEFSTMLSTVVNDPSIKQIEPVAEKEKFVPVQANADSATVVPPVVIVQKEEIKKDKTKIIGEGKEITYIDINGDQQDTIVIIIPVDKSFNNVSADNAVQTDINKSKEDVPVQKVDEPLAKPGVQTDTVVVENKVKEPETKKAPEFLNIDINPPVVDKAKDNSANHDSMKGEVVTPRPVMINSDCKNFATDEDFLKLRKKMVSADEDDKMIEVAKKVFRTRCFTTEQIRNLGSLFLKDAGRYSFYDAAYPFVSDSHNYSTLAAQLSDPYYINRFNIMIRH